MKRICFIAPSGYGKSTAIKILEKKYKIQNIKIAEPMYKMQEYFYSCIKTKIKGEQDGELLQFLGQKIRKENPTFLLDEFSQKLKNADQQTIITNDDCRPPDYEYLSKLGFVFVGINGFRHDRLDHSPINQKASIEWQNDIKCDYYVSNTSSLKDYEIQILSLMEKILW